MRFGKKQGPAIRSQLFSLNLSRRRAPEYAPRVFGESEASASRRAAGVGRSNPSSPPQTFDPRVASFGDPDLEAVEFGLQLPVRRQPGEEGVDEAGAAGAGVFSRIRPTASAVIRNHTCWLPSASSAAPNQRIRPLGSRVGSRGVRVWAPPGQSSRVPAMTIFGPGGVGHAFPPAPPKLSTINRHSRRPDRPRTRPQPISPNPTTRGAASSTSTTETAACFPGHCPPLPADHRGDPALPWPERVADAPSAPIAVGLLTDTAVVDRQQLRRRFSQ